MEAAHLRSSSEFQKVYRAGSRYEGQLLIAFVLPNTLACHRLGVTASRKVLGKAVDRNRAKRLLRETFRSTREPLERLQRHYDWVLNARKGLITPEARRSRQRLTEFSRIVASVATSENVNDVVGT